MAVELQVQYYKKISIVVKIQLHFSQIKKNHETITSIEYIIRSTREVLRYKPIMNI